MVSESSFHKSKFRFLENLSADSDLFADFFLRLNEKVFKIHHVFLDEFHIQVVLLDIFSSFLSVFEDKSGIFSLNNFNGGVDDLFIGFQSDHLRILDILNLNLGSNTAEFFLREMEFAGRLINKSVNLLLSLLSLRITSSLVLLLGDLEFLSDELINPLSSFE